MKGKSLLPARSILSVLMAALFLAVLPGCQQQTDPRDVPLEYVHTPDHPLTGTKWLWDSQWGRRTLSFDTPDEAMYHDQNEGIYLVSYIYDKNKKMGRIDVYGEFAVIDDYETMAFSNWKNYGHGSEYIRLME
ncbi:hypothetical protein TREAZ_0523 [Leadbettera azotonutricia ZAS-9]|uniref:Lipoprotein n=2 Tax=Leadbettera azotonutricia TaxID=150829 RepID=F5YC50_LEAAZ|nr:hypothetical protein TREAZ_0523 [Leadbettera azotonutricia ZAS-9]